MTCLYKDRFSNKEVNKYVNILRANALNNIQIICWHLQDKKTDDFHLDTDEGEQAIEIIAEAGSLTEEVVEAIKYLWEEEPLIQEVTNTARIGLDSQTPFYLDNVERFAEEEYTPTIEDILKARLKTTGITETFFSVEETKFRIVDVGGQRSERRKWLSRFRGDITAVLYLAALDEFDKALIEDPDTNRFDESLKLFGEVTSSQWFTETPFIVFMNKSDLFRKKIQQFPSAMKERFADISEEDSADYQGAVHYIQNKYEGAFGGNGRLYMYETCAIDTDGISKVFYAVRDVILSQELARIGF
eukprot:TRINITY_DN6156_c0_g1_i1.p1 TRINITY_DN6156_c0_g1~~TRINITY_DN6156_c0_g1_i1.p1  ORF type:complete len:302 (-),score=67.23 TRINITY_DN6156_c0_g1_i1:61-966(-)